MTILVTGASGYLGKTLIKEYENSNNKIILTYRKNKLKNLKSNFFWKELNLYSKQIDIYNFLQQPKTLIHLAWDGLNLKDYESDIHIKQIDYHFNFIESLIKNGLKNIIILGTCFEYGDYEGEISEEMLPNPITQYGRAKNSLRIKIESLKSKYDFNLTWLRLFYFFGGDHYSNNLWSNINIAVKSQQDSFNISKGTQLRDYLHIEEIARYIKIISSINKDLGIVNICSNIPISIKEITNKWVKDNNWKIKIESNKIEVKDYEIKDFWGSKKKLDTIINKN